MRRCATVFHMGAGASELFRDLLVNYGAAQLGALSAAFVGAIWLAFVLFRLEPIRRFDRLRKRSTVDAIFVYGTVFLVSGAAGVTLWFSARKWGPAPAKPLEAKDVAEEVVRRLPKPELAVAPTAPSRPLAPSVTLRFARSTFPVLVLTNQSPVVARDIKWSVYLWNMDAHGRSEDVYESIRSGPSWHA